MPDDLRAHLKELCALHVQGDSLEPLLADILPLVEQAIQQEREPKSCDVCEYEFEGGDRKHNVVCSQCWPHGKALAEKDAQIAALQEWRNAALRVGEDLAADGPNGYYNFTARQYLDWALARLRETPAPPQTQEHLSGVNDDYYLPGKKAGG